MKQEKRKPGRPRGTKPAMIKTSICMRTKTLERIDKDRGDVPRSRFLLNKAGYGDES